MINEGILSCKYTNKVFRLIFNIIKEAYAVRSLSTDGKR